jgi:hypothetical protein
MRGKQEKFEPIMRNLYIVYKSYNMFGRNWIQESIAALKHNPITEIEAIAARHRSGGCGLHIICGADSQFILTKKPHVRQNN